MELNTACDIKVRPWGELLLALRRGEADAVIAAHAVTPQSLAEVDFTDRYFQTPGRFAARRGGETVEITPETLESKRIGVAKNTAHEAFLRAFFRSSAIQAYENADLARDALIQGQVDYIFDDGIGLVFWLHGTASKRCCELKGGPYLEPKFFGDGIAIAVPKTDSQIKTLINGALAKPARPTGGSTSWSSAISRSKSTDAHFACHGSSAARVAGRPPLTTNAAVVRRTVTILQT